MCINALQRFVTREKITAVTALVREVCFYLVSIVCSITGEGRIFTPFALLILSAAYIALVFANFFHLCDFQNMPEYYREMALL
jgi:hypothetical protein